MMVLGFKMNVHTFFPIAIPNGIFFFIVVPVWYQCFVYSLHTLYILRYNSHNIVNDLNAFTVFIFAVVLLIFRKGRINFCTLYLSRFSGGELYTLYPYIFFRLFTWWFPKKIFTTKKTKAQPNQMNIMNLLYIFFSSQKKEGKRNVFRFTSWNVTYNIYLRRTLWIWSDFMINSMNYIDCFQWIHCMLKSLTFLHVRRTFIRLLEWNLMNSCANILTWNYLSKCIHSR